MPDPVSPYREIVKNTVATFFNVRDEYKDKTVEEIRQIAAKESFPFAVCALNIEGDLNIGMMIRTASLMGAERFIIYGRRKFDSRSMVGANNYFPVDKIDGLTPTGEIDLRLPTVLLSMGYIPIFIEQGGVSLETANWALYDRIAQLKPAKKICFVFGNESTGIPPEMMINYTVISIPQQGVLRSLNVAAATSMVLWDYVSKVHLNK